MSPNLENQMPESSHIETNNGNIYLSLTPLSDLSISTSHSEENVSESESHLESIEQQVDAFALFNNNRNYLPLEHNLRELLVKVSNTEELETVTQIKLRVIAWEVALQQLALYLPALRELILDGSIVYSLRELGNGLRNLKILKVNRCQLPCIDGVLGLEDLEELYAADNEIKDLSPCAFLNNLKILDVRRNAVKHFECLSFLSLCVELKHLLLQGNDFVEESPEYRHAVKNILPNLEMLDELSLEQPDSSYSCDDHVGTEEIEENESENATIPDALRVTQALDISLPTSSRLVDQGVQIDATFCAQESVAKVACRGRPIHDVHENVIRSRMYSKGLHVTLSTLNEQLGELDEVKICLSSLKNISM